MNRFIGYIYYMIMNILMKKLIFIPIAILLILLSVSLAEVISPDDSSVPADLTEGSRLV